MNDAYVKKLEESVSELVEVSRHLFNSAKSDDLQVFWQIAHLKGLRGRIAIGGAGEDKKELNRTGVIGVLTWIVLLIFFLLLYVHR